jgi:hypothetical protein
VYRVLNVFHRRTMNIARWCVDTVTPEEFAKKFQGIKCVREGRILLITDAFGGALLHYYGNEIKLGDGQYLAQQATTHTVTVLDHRDYSILYGQLTEPSHPSMLIKNVFPPPLP